MVIISLSEREDPGSSPGGTTIFPFGLKVMTHLFERCSDGSSPSRGSQCPVV